MTLWTCRPALSKLRRLSMSCVEESRSRADATRAPPTVQRFSGSGDKAEDDLLSVDSHPQPPSSLRFAGPRVWIGDDYKGRLFADRARRLKPHCSSEQFDFIARTIHLAGESDEVNESGAAPTYGSSSLTVAGFDDPLRFCLRSDEEGSQDIEVRLFLVWAGRMEEEPI
jgi:hypothetical protein